MKLIPESGLRLVTEPLFNFTLVAKNLMPSDNSCQVLYKFAISECSVTTCSENFSHRFKEDHQWISGAKQDISEREAGVGEGGW